MNVKDSSHPPLALPPHVTRELTLRAAIADSDPNTPSFPSTPRMMESPFQNARESALSSRHESIDFPALQAREARARLSAVTLAQHNLPPPTDARVLANIPSLIKERTRQRLSGEDQRAVAEAFEKNSSSKSDPGSAQMRRRSAIVYMPEYQRITRNRSDAETVIPLMPALTSQNLPEQPRANSQDVRSPSINIYLNQGGGSSQQSGPSNPLNTPYEPSPLGPQPRISEHTDRRASTDIEAIRVALSQELPAGATANGNGGAFFSYRKAMFAMLTTIICTVGAAAVTALITALQNRSNLANVEKDV